MSVPFREIDANPRSKVPHFYQEAFVNTPPVYNWKIDLKYYYSENKIGPSSLILIVDCGL